MSVGLGTPKPQFEGLTGSEIPGVNRKERSDKATLFRLPGEFRNVGGKRQVKE
jgi:hypothetical protein